MITKESSADGSGLGSIGSASLKESRNGHCSTCGALLETIVWRRQYLVAHVCDNILCCRFRSPQFYTELPASPDPPPKRKKPRFRTPAQARARKRKRENYHLLVSLGVPTVEARCMTSDVQTNNYLESIGYERS